MHLKRCPFCSSDNVSVTEFGEGARQNFSAHCRGCLADGPVKPTRVECVAAWNTRTDRKDGDGRDHRREG